MGRKKKNLVQEKVRGHNRTFRSKRYSKEVRGTTKHVVRYTRTVQA